MPRPTSRRSGHHHLLKVQELLFDSSKKVFWTNGKTFGKSIDCIDRSTLFATFNSSDISAVELADLS